MRNLIQERERTTRYSFSGLSKSEKDQLRDDLDLYSGKIITDALLISFKNISRNYFVGKGFFNAKATITTTSDTLVNNSRILKINVVKEIKFKDQ